MSPHSSGASLHDFILRHPRLLVITGAGLSTRSGIPDYRDADGQWKVTPPMQFREFRDSAAARRRYWARSLAGWPRFSTARPNEAHSALSRLETLGHVTLLVTQNVDGLHQRAGSRRVLDLHGRLDRVRCLDCGASGSRENFQQRLGSANPGFGAPAASIRPDGDALLDPSVIEGFAVPACAQCGGVLKPDVVFFGEAVPPARVDSARAALAQADAVLAVGTSLMVWSAYRFLRAAAEAGKPAAAVNLGRTRADGQLALKLEHDCADTLRSCIAALSMRRGARTAGHRAVNRVDAGGYNPRLQDSRPAPAPAFATDRKDDDG
ncbi:MAG: NAD-dependent protein deacetylase [Chromatiales bacterium]|nr:NAD-dependent protein deacetylase [Chromatiales bacterium]